MIYQIVYYVLDILSWAIIIRALLSWFPNLGNSPIVRTLHEITDPLLRPFQRFQVSGGSFGIDLSPLIAYFAIKIVQSMVLPVIFRILSSIIS